MPPDKDKISRISEDLTEVLSEYSLTEDATASEAIFAVISVLSTLLKGVKKLQDPNEKIQSAAQINAMLLNLMVENSSRPN